MKINKLNLLIAADHLDKNLLNPYPDSDYWNLHWKYIYYSKLYQYLPEFRDLIQKHDIDFIVFSRNDQIGKKISIGPFIKKLKTGYTTFSGIDQQFSTEEMQKCFYDFIHCNQPLTIDHFTKGKNCESINSQGTFSLVFDTEQIACAKYGLPRILQVLCEFNVEATFFITNIMQVVYPKLSDTLVEYGHEIGIHGKYHEYLSELDEEQQSIAISEMIHDWKREIIGANFIGRMNQDTIKALIKNHVRYCVFPHINYYSIMSYPRLSTKIYSIQSDAGKLIMIPIAVETYGSPWFSIKNMVDSAVEESKKSNSHITILCHPFRDGNSDHIDVTKKLIKYLIFEKKLKPVQLRDLAGDERGNISINSISELPRNVKILQILPHSKRDIMAFLPQNIMLAYKLINRRRTIW